MEDKLKKDSMESADSCGCGHEHAHHSHDEHEEHHDHEHHHHDEHCGCGCENHDHEDHEHEHPHHHEHCSCGCEDHKHEHHEHEHLHHHDEHCAVAAEIMSTTITPTMLSPQSVSTFWRTSAALTVLPKWRNGSRLLKASKALPLLLQQNSFA